MTSNYREITLGDLIIEGGGNIKTGPFGTTLKASEYSENGVPVISVGEVGFGKLRLHQRTPRVGKDIVERLPEYLLREGDIVFGRKGAVERSAWVKPTQDGWFLGSDGIRLRLPKTVNSRFISYLLLTEKHKTWMMTNCVGTTMHSLNQGVIERIPIILPPLSIQNQVSDILSAFDEKIEINQQMNHTLEQVARAVFKSWFIDFAPTHAKMRGHQPEGMHTKIAALFPDRLVDIDGKEVPQGWQRKTIDELYTLRGGSTPSTSNPEFWEGGTLHWTSPKDLSGVDVPFLTTTDKKITEAGVNVISSGILPAGTILLSSRAPVGYLAIADMPISINQGYIAIEAKFPQKPYFTLNLIQDNLEQIKGIASGTTFPELSKAAFKNFEVLWPDINVINAFNDIVTPIYNRIRMNIIESANLLSIRDLIISKLLSSEFESSELDDLI